MCFPNAPRGILSRQSDELLLLLHVLEVQSYGYKWLQTRQLKLAAQRLILHYEYELALVSPLAWYYNACPYNNKFTVDRACSRALVQLHATLHFINGDSQELGDIRSAGFQLLQIELVLLAIRLYLHTKDG